MKQIKYNFSRWIVLMNISFFYLILIPMAGSLTENLDSWSQLGHNSYHTFSSEITVPENLEIKWVYDGDISYGSSPAIINDRVFVYGDQKVISLNLENGNSLFEVPAHITCPSTPTIIDGRLYFAHGEHTFQCLEVASQLVVWEKFFPDLYWINPLVHDDAVFITTDNINATSQDLPLLDCGMVPMWLTLIAVDRDTGKEIWQYSTTSSNYHSRNVGFPVLVGDSLFFYESYFKSEKDYDDRREQSNLVCLDAKKGTVLFKRECLLPKSPSIYGSITPAWISIYAEKMYTSIKGNIICTDLEGQTILWEYSFSEGWNALLAVGQGIVIGHTSTNVHCIDAETGRKLWNIPLKGDTIPVITKDDVFIGSSDGYLYRINNKTGEIKKKYALGGYVFSPVVIQNNVLVGTSNGVLYCFGPSGYNYWVIGGLCISLMVAIIILLKLRDKL